jgi:hypothetical protein
LPHDTRSIIIDWWFAATPLPITLNPIPLYNASFHR